MPELLLRRPLVVSGSRLERVDNDVALGTAPGAGTLDDAVLLPGLVDLHTHVFSGQDLGVSADEAAERSGVTAMVDAGSAGGDLFGAFAAIALRSRTRLRAFVNISSIGTTSIQRRGELRSPEYIDEELVVRTMAEHPGLAVGVKVRASANVGGRFTTRALAAARRAADRAAAPLMVHLGPKPASIDTIVRTLGAGDILTHCFTGFAGNTLIENGRIRPSVRRARERGVLFDVGHGVSGFDPAIARAAIEQDFPPDTISTDLHAYSTRAAVDLPTVIGRIVAAGMPWADALQAATRTPALAVGLDGAGILSFDSPCDVVVARIAGTTMTVEHCARDAVLARL